MNLNLLSPLRQFAPNCWISLTHISCHGTSRSFSPRDESDAPSGEHPAVSTARQRPGPAEGTAPINKHPKGHIPYSCKGFPSLTWTPSPPRTAVMSFSTTAPLGFSFTNIRYAFFIKISALFYTLYSFPQIFLGIFIPLLPILLLNHILCF